MVLRYQWYRLPVGHCLESVCGRWVRLRVGCQYVPKAVGIQKLSSSVIANSESLVVLLFH